MKTPRERVDAFFNHHPNKTYAKGDVIARPGQDLPGILYLCEGRVTQYDIAEDGSEIQVNVFQPPAFFPISWALNDTPNLYFFKAAEKVTSRCAPKAEVVEFLRMEPEVVLDLLSRVYRGTEGVLRRMAHSMGGSAATLLTHELIVALRRHGEAEGTGRVALRTTAQELASRTGLARETVTRELNAMKAKGFITLSRGKVVVDDLSELEKSLGSRL